MRTYLLLNLIDGSEHYFDNACDFESALVSVDCGSPKVIRYLSDDTRAYFVYQISNLC